MRGENDTLLGLASPYTSIEGVPLRFIFFCMALNLVVFRRFLHQFCAILVKISEYLPSIRRRTTPIMRPWCTLSTRGSGQRDSWTVEMRLVNYLRFRGLSFDIQWGAALLFKKTNFVLPKNISGLESFTVPHPSQKKESMGSVMPPPPQYFT